MNRSIVILSDTQHGASAPPTEQAQNLKKKVRRGYLDQLLFLEIIAQIKHLPRGQRDQAANGEDAEPEHTGVGRLIGISHFLFTFTHVLEVIDNFLCQVLQSAELQFKWL
eukprot:scpid61265/ scgid29154/ 